MIMSEVIIFDNNFKMYLYGDTIVVEKHFLYILCCFDLYVF